MNERKTFRGDEKIVCQKVPNLIDHFHLDKYMHVFEDYGDDSVTRKIREDWDPNFTLRAGQKFDLFAPANHKGRVTCVRVVSVPNEGKQVIS